MLDIDATAAGVEPNYDVIMNIAAECRMPLCYGGGVRTVAQAKRIVGLGVEKVAIGAAAVEVPGLVRGIADSIGTQSVVAVADVRRRERGATIARELCTHNGKRVQDEAPLAFAKRMETEGAGEILVNSIDRDGRMAGYDLDFARLVRQEVGIPLTILGGAGSHADLQRLFGACGIVGAAAGSLFVFKGRFRAVLINYPDAAQREEIGQAAFTPPPIP